VGTEPVEYCREIETYLCRKNDGHLIRVVGPSFDLVSRWAADGVPLKVAFAGIDRCVERYTRKGPRRRPVRIDFCEADVLDVFDEWRRAVGLAAAATTDQASAGSGRGGSLPAHIERVVMKLTQARVAGRLGPDADAILDGLSVELDAARASKAGIRGDARRLLLERLEALDRELLRAARASLAPGAAAAIDRDAHEELSGYRGRMTPDAYERAHAAAAARLLRERLGLPTLTF
jgi:hypothetical protein